MRKFLLLFCLALVFPWATYAQSTQAPLVQFQSGGVEFPANLDLFLQQTDYLSEQVAGRYYRYLQFTGLPDAALRERLARYQIHLLRYVPKHCYLVSLPVNLNPQVLKSLQVRSVMRPAITHKLSRLLTEAAFPDEAIQGDRISLVMQYPADLPMQAVVDYLSNYDVVIQEQWAASHTLQVQIKLSFIEGLADLPVVSFMEPLAPKGQPEGYFGRILHRANLLNSEHAQGRHFDGTGVGVLVRDDGVIGPHIDFEGRTDQNNATAPSGTHGDMVAGIFAGAGNLNPLGQGHASGAMVFVSDYVSTFTDNTLSLHQNQGVMVTNSSYSDGCNRGYTTVTERVDRQMHENPSFLHVFSAGNNGNGECGGGNGVSYGAGDKWGNITGGHKQGKNVIAVANLGANGNLQTSSSRGPAHDGRIKPDLAAHGANQLSTDPNNGYSPGGGTSAAAPSTAGTVAQLYHLYKSMHGDTMPESALIKAALLNTATDRGNPGPDFRFGWGQINGHRAGLLLEENRFFQDTISQGQTNSHTLSIPANLKELRVMIYWMDPEGFPGASTALVNDLNMRLRASNGQIHFPWLLDHTPTLQSLNAPAQTGRDSLNNMEQVAITNPAAGTYFLSIDGFALGMGPQKYYVLYEFIPEDITITHPSGGEGLVPFEKTRLIWDAAGNQGNFTLEYSLDDGQSWHMIAAALPGNLRYYDWQVPNASSGQARVRISRQGVNGQSEFPFSITRVPQNLEVLQVCSKSALLYWDPVPGATGYDVFVLGATHMDSVGHTDQHTYQLALNSATDNFWFSVRATGPDGMRSRRAIALEKTGAKRNCTTGPDLALMKVLAPGNVAIPNCHDSLAVTFRIFNQGDTAVSNFTLNYQLVGGSLVSEAFPDTLEPGDLYDFTFQAPLGVPALPITHTLSGFISLPIDPNPNNNIIQQPFAKLDGSPKSLPFAEDFESNNLCGTSSNCENEVCNLVNGWTNLNNSVQDDIDWRVDVGGTPSSGTGPGTDHNPGTSSGKYLYLEASNGCTEQMASLASPCLDFTGVDLPVLKFWYHMFGSSIGELHLDVFNGQEWVMDVMSPIIGNQGDEWHEAVVKLDAFNGGIVSFRLRGITGGGFASDIAIDDIEVLDLGLAPDVAFSTSHSLTCLQEAVQLTDESDLIPTAWNWDIQPATFSYLYGTNANSQHPVVAFSQYGVYDIQLIASNAFGTDTLTQQELIEVTEGFTLPMTEDFESGVFPPVNWRIDNSDLLNTWTAFSSVNLSGNISQVSQMNNFTYNGTGEIDGLSSGLIDLRTAIQPTLTFELAYARLSALEFETLRIEVSTDCGNTFNIPVYQKQDLDLATAGTKTSNWIPFFSSEWRRDTVDLSAFAGQVISLKFVNVNGYGNNLFLDNIQVSDPQTIAPIAAIEASDVEICVGEVLVLADTSSGNNLKYRWNFGPKAAPLKANFPGPHSVVFSEAGLYPVVLSLSNAVGSSNDTIWVQVNPLPEANFQIDLAGGGWQTYTFSSLASHADSLSWDLGDGTLSQDSAVVHTYTVNGDYSITLVVYNDCGTDTLQQQLAITNVGVDEALADLSLQVAPNPNEGAFVVSLQGQKSGMLSLALRDLRGRELYRQKVFFAGGETQIPVSVEGLAKGVYLLSVQREKGILYRRVMIK